MVATALRDLGAQVITVEQLPRGEAAEGDQAGQPGEPSPEEAT
jgi:crotonobetainyl-CoA:carnitine CoA-transferase CaiB-like acyl-CoA transferase